MPRDEASLTRFRRYLPDVADGLTTTRHRTVTRHSVSMFADIAGFTSMSERLARFGTAGTEQVGELVRLVIGGSLDAVAVRGGDALTFGGDAVAVEFRESPRGVAAWDRARAAADDVVSVFASVAGRTYLAGPLDLTVRIGVADGRVTTVLSPGEARHVLVQLGPGLDRAAEAAGRAEPNRVVVEHSDDDATPAPAVGHQPTQVPTWAPRLFHPLTASRIAAGTEPPDEHRRVTCVFLSLPPVDDRDRSALTALSGFVAHAADTVDRGGGDFVQCSGGDKGIVAYAVFGAPIAHPDDALRAVHAVERLRATTDMPFAAGIATGLTFAASFGGEHRRFFSAIGDTTNLAARLMAAAPASGTLVDQATSDACQGRLLLGQVRNLSVKNRVAPVAANRLLGLAGAIPPVDADGETPLVGRERALSAGEELLDAAMHRGSALHLSGVAGSGKSRLASEIGRRAQIRGLAVRAAAFEPFSVGGPFGPFGGFLRRRPGRSPITSDADLTDAIAHARPGDEGLAPLLAPLLDLPVSATAATAGLTEDQRADLGRRLLVDLLCDIGTPTLLVVEDLHWADEASQRMLADLVPRLPDTTLSMVTTRRPLAFPGCEPVLELGDLEAPLLATIVTDTWSRLGGTGLPDEYVATLVQRAAGSPMFAQTVTELVRRSYRPGVPLPEVPLPDELLPFLTAALDTLGDTAQHAALQVAVLGRPTSAAELAQVFGTAIGDVESDVARLGAAGIVRRSTGPDGDQIAIRHATVAEALLERASHSVRRPLHERVCVHLVAAGASAREVAGHLQHCHLPELEPTWFRAARDEASSAWALHEARHWAELALRTAPAQGAQDDALALAVLEEQLGDVTAATRRLADLSGVDAQVLRGRIALETGQPAQALEYLQAAERHGAHGPRLTWPMTMALCELGRFGEARARAVDLLATGADDPAIRLDVSANLGVIEAQQGDFDAATASLEQARDLAGALGDRMRLAIITGDLAGALFLLGRTADAAQLLGQAASMAERLGSRRMVAMTWGNAAMVRLAGGDAQGAGRAAIAAVRASIEVGDLTLAANSLQIPIDVAEIDGLTAEAAAWWRRHALLEEQLGRPSVGAVSWLRRASLLALTGDPTGARSARGRALALDEDADSEDVRVELARADAALAGAYTPPAIAAATPIALPPLDASLPDVNPQAVDDLFDQIALALAARAQAR